MPNRKPSAGGGIVRRAHDRENPYVMISRALADDTTLSLEARGLMLYLLSKPPDWQVQMRDLQRTAGCARDKMQRIMKELETARYVVRECHHDTRGHWNWESTVHEVPQIEPLPDFPVTVQPVTVAPSPDKAVIQKEETGLTKDVPKIEETAAPPNKNGSAPLSDYLIALVLDHARELWGDSRDFAAARQIATACAQAGEMPAYWAERCEVARQQVKRRAKAERRAAYLAAALAPSMTL